MTSLQATVFRGATAPAGIPCELAWPDDFKDFKSADARLSTKDVTLWSPATFDDDYRLKENVIAVHALVLDYDAKHRPVDPGELMDRWTEYEHILHSTYTPGRFRIVLPYKEPVTGPEHEALYAAIVAKDPDLDGSTKDASRGFYVPTHRSDLDAPPVFDYNEGELLDVRRMLGDLRVSAASSGRPSAVERLSQRGQNQTAPSRAPSSTDQGHGGGGAIRSIYDDLARGKQRESLPLIESRCAFMARYRDDIGRTKSDPKRLDEPEWYAALSIVSRCVGGDTIAMERHRDSDAYGTEDAHATKYERAAAAGPRTCADIRTLSAACRGCTLQVTSPVLLGRVPVSPVIDSPVVPADDGDATSPLLDAVREAEERLDKARTAERDALVKLEQARRAMRILRTAGALTSEEETTNAALAVNDAKRALSFAERERAGAEKTYRAARAKTSVEGLPPGADPGVWQSLRMVAGRPADTLGNVLSILGEDPKWSSRLSYDTFAQEVLRDGAPLAEERATELTAQLAYDYQLDTTSARVIECVRAVARRHETHPVRDWLRSLAWDGVSRIGDLMRLGFGADLSTADEEDCELVSTIGEKFMLSLVARVMRPGCKMDTMLVLTGKQGTGKSTSFETLVGQEWFSRSKLDLLGKDGFLNLRGNWLYEIDELSSMKKVESHQSKAWLSSSVDQYRAPYARRSEKHPRQTVMCGTTNEDEFLMDPTGHRRYWPVRVLQCDLEWLAANRAQLFAEAVALYDIGRTWWFDEGTEMAERLRVWVAPFAVNHPWTESVVAYLCQTKRDTFTLVDLLSGIHMDVKDMAPGDQATMGAIVRQLGCPRVRRVQVGGATTTLYARPTDFNVARLKAVGMGGVGVGAAADKRTA